MDFSDCVELTKYRTSYLDNLDVTIRDPYRDFLDLFLEQIKDIEGTYGKVCILYYVLTVYLGNDFHRRYGKKFYSTGLKNVLFYYYFLTLLKRSAVCFSS